MNFFRIALLLSPLVCAAADARGVCRMVITTQAPRQPEFQAELALTPEARAVGLMGREFLARNAAMLFDFGTERPVSMWMKDTPISLDMAFFRATGELVHVARGTEPRSLRLITSPVPVRYVLEVGAGEARDLDPAAGARLDINGLAECAAQSRASSP